MFTVDTYAQVRRAVLIEGRSRRSVAQELGLSRNTVAKMVKHHLPPGYRRKAAPVSPKLDAFTGIIDQILEDDKLVIKKQRHTAKRILERLRDEHGFTGGYTIVRSYVMKQQLRMREVFMPLHHPAGQAQADFGETDIIYRGCKTLVHFFCLSLPHSDAFYVKVYPAETTEAWLDGHVSAFAWLGGIPQSILYDNSKMLVSSINKQTKERTLTDAFKRLHCHYLFDTRFGRPARGNDKGKVEGIVGYSRRNFLVPMPRVQSLDELNVRLQEACERRLKAVLRGHSGTIGARLQADKAHFLPLSDVPFDACESVSTKVSSLSLVRYRCNDYSVPTEYAYQTVQVRGYVDRVVIGHAAKVIAVHERNYGKAQFVYNPLHYLALLETKPNALNQAAPLHGWALPEDFERLRRLMEARLGNGGRREYIQVLRLLEDFGEEEVAVAVEESLRLSTISYDAVKHLVLAKHERRQPRLNLSAYPHVPQASVGTTDTRAYMSLLTQEVRHVA